MTHRPSSYLRVAALGTLVAAALFVVPTRLAAQELEQQVELSVQLLELSVAEWKERADVPAANGADGSARSAALAALEKKYKAERARLYESHFTSATAHLTFFATHADEVAAYLEENPDIKSRIDSLSQTLRSLITQEESKGAVAPGVPQ